MRCSAALLCAATAAAEMPTLNLHLCTDSQCGGCQTTSGGEGECVPLTAQGVEFSLIGIMEGGNVRGDVYIGAGCTLFANSIVAGIDTCLPGADLPLPGLAESYYADVNQKAPAPPAPLKLKAPLFPPAPDRRRALSLDLCTDAACSAGCQTTTAAEGECVPFPVQGVEFSMIGVLEGSQARADLYVGAGCSIFSTSILAAANTCLPGSDLPLPGVAESFVVRTGQKVKPAPPAPRREGVNLHLCTDSNCGGCQTTSGAEGECVALTVQGVDFSLIGIVEGGNIRGDVYIGAGCTIFANSIVAGKDTCLPGADLPLPGMAESYYVSTGGRNAPARSVPLKVNMTRNAAARRR